MRSKIRRMLDTLYWLELMDPWDTHWEIEDAADAAYDAYYMRLNEVRDEK